MEFIRAYGEYIAMGFAGAFTLFLVSIPIICRGGQTESLESRGVKPGVMYAPPADATPANSALRPAANLARNMPRGHATSTPHSSPA